jgi:hypothetical protein
MERDRGQRSPEQEKPTTQRSTNPKEQGKLSFGFTEPQLDQYDESKARPSPEQEIKPISIELTTKREQEIMLEIADRALYAGTYQELRSSRYVKEENDIWRPIFKKLANNLGRQYKPKELLLRGIIDDIPLQTLEQWAKSKGQLSPEEEVIRIRSKYFLREKRKALEKEKK